MPHTRGSCGGDSLRRYECQPANTRNTAVNVFTIKQLRVDAGFPIPSLTTLLVAGLAYLILLTPIAYTITGWHGVAGLAVSSTLCVLPGCATLLFVSCLKRKRVAFLLIGTGLRLTCVFAGILIAKSKWPSYATADFYVWLVLAYLWVLFVETWLTIRSN